MIVPALRIAARNALGVLLVFALTACASSRGGPIPYDHAGSFKAPDAPTVATLASGYRITPMDNVVLAVESGKTRTASALEALNRLRAAGANVLGATLTKSAEEKSSYGYAYKYGRIDNEKTEIVMLAHQPAD